MLFNSIEYIILLAVSVVAYWLAPSLRYRQGIVLSASIYFYMSWSQVFILMLLGLILVNSLIWKSAISYLLDHPQVRMDVISITKRHCEQAFALPVLEQQLQHIFATVLPSTKGIENAL